MDFHSWLLHRPALGLPHLDPWIYGSGPTIIDLQAQLAALLATKGVPTAYCECSKKCPAAIKKLGAPSIANPWHALKALTSKPGNNFQYVLLFKSVCAKSASSSSKPLDLMQVEEPFTLVIRRVYFVWAQLFKTSAHIPHSMTPKKDHSL